MILTVFHCGKGRFKPEHVERLYRQVRRHCPASVPFRCITRERFSEAGIETIPMRHKWPDYWCKIECFAVRGPILYMDLDTTILGDLTPLLEAVQQHDFIAQRRLKNQEGIQTALMGWRGDVSRLYDRFKGDRHIRKYRARERPAIQTDEGYTYDHWDGELTLWQDILPGMTMSYKKGWLLGAPRDDCRIVYFHGRPRPWEVEEIAA